MIQGTQSTASEWTTGTVEIKKPKRRPRCWREKKEVDME
jgi:hypothetical protein